MADITITEDFELDDSEAHGLANEFESSAAIVATLLTTGRFHMVIADVASATEAVSGGGYETVTSSAAATDALAIPRQATLRSSAVATESTSGTQQDTITLTSSAAATEGVGGTFSATSSSSAVATETVTPNRAMTLESLASATGTIVLARVVTTTISDTAGAGDGQSAPNAQSIDESAIVGDTVIGKRIVTDVFDDVAVSQATALNGVSTGVTLKSAAAAAATLLQGITVIETLTSTADAEDNLRLPASAIPAFVVNAQTGAPALWQGLPFNSLVEADGVIYGASADGIGVLALGADDIDTPIDAEVTWDLVNMGTTQLKRPYAVYVAGQGGPFTVRVTNKQGTYDYLTQLPRTDGATNHRAKPGRGLQSAYYRFSLLANRDFAADHVVVEHEQVARRLS